MFRIKNRTHLIKHKVGGHTFWTFATIAAVPGRRRIEFAAALRMAELGVTTKDIYACIDAIEEAAKAQDFSKIIKITHTLNQYLQIYASEKTIFEIASPLILLGNEPFNEQDDVYKEKKKKLYNSNYEVKSFFFNSTELILKDIRAWQHNISIEDYLKDRTVQLTEKLFSQLMQEIYLDRSTSQNTSKS